VKLSIRRTVVGAALILLDRSMDFARALALPIVVSVTSSYLLSYLPKHFAVSIAANLIEYAIYTVIAVTTHRLYLLGPAEVPAWGFRKWRDRELRFLAWSLALFAAPSYVISSLGFSDMFVWVPILIYFLLLPRISLLFPAIAVDRSF